MTFQVNHLGPFLLTNLLIETLKKSNSSRIVNVSSVTHKFWKMNKTNLNGERTYIEIVAYARSKLANVLFTRELAKRLKDTTVVVNCLHPGVIRTNIYRKYYLWYSLVILPFSKSVKSGAQTTLAVALDPEFEKFNGQYFCDCKIGNVSKAASDDDMADWLWRTSEKFTELTK